MNAYEHGNLGIDSKVKHRLIEDDIYFDTLKEMEVNCNKNITIRLFEDNGHIFITIKDEGDGFDINSLRTIFGRGNSTFNGRGISSSAKMVDLLIYNFKANEVIVIKKI